MQVGNRALHIEWGVAPRLAVVVCNDAVNVCRKTLLSSTYRDGYSIMQVRIRHEGGHPRLCFGAHLSGIQPKL